ncbi:MAG: transposase [Patescibacteria group bacterium]
MYYLAFDVSKNKLDGILTNLRTKNEYFQIDNNYQSIADWLNRSGLPKKLICGCESTGGYHLLVRKLFVEKGFIFKVINPILVKQFTRTTIRKKKTDMTDSLIIAKLLAQGEGYQINSGELDLTAKILQRGSNKLINEKHKLHLMRKSLNFQEQNEAILSLSDKFKEIEDKIEKTINEHISSLKKGYSKEPVMELLESIPGIGFKLAFTIWTEVGDINRFEDSSKLVAFSGLDPKIRQSGHCLNNQGKLTKRGSPHLRRALFVAANVARMRDPELKLYYEKKRKEGKRFTVAVCAVARKLISRIYAVWIRQTPYVKKEVYSLNTSKTAAEMATA